MLMTGTTLFTSLFLAYIVELLSAWSYDGLKGYHRNPEGFGLRVGLWLNKHICRPKWAWFSDPFDFCKGVWKTYKYGHDAFTDMPTWEKYQGALSGKDDTAVRSMQSLENLFVDRLKMLNDKVKGKEQQAIANMKTIRTLQENSNIQLMTIKALEKKIGTMKQAEAIRNTPHDSP